LSTTISTLVNNVSLSANVTVDKPIGYRVHNASYLNMYLIIVTIFAVVLIIAIIVLTTVLMKKKSNIRQNTNYVEFPLNILDRYIYDSEL
jgi:uncharacterized membrane protein